MRHLKYLAVGVGAMAFGAAGCAVLFGMAAGAFWVVNQMPWVGVGVLATVFVYIYGRMIVESEAKYNGPKYPVMTEEEAKNFRP